ncbi:MAG: glycosyl transferase [Clostridia bacterium]|nr:glycosyl transferase [Clostridia bacterium]
MSFLTKVKNYVAHISDESALGDKIYYFAKYGTAKFLGAIWSEEHYARWFYHLYTGKHLNLDDPQRFDEKVWWLKLNNRDPMLTKCSDKYLVREYIKQCGYEDILIPQYEAIDSVKKLDITKYKEEVIAKCNHNSGGHLFYDPEHPLTKKELKVKLKKLKYIMKQDASVLSKEWNYKNIPHKIIVEKVIRDKEGNLPLDYKFMCFDGEPKLLFLDLGVIREDKVYNHDYPRNIYDMDFNLLPVYETRPNADYEVPKPENFERMVEIARKLSQPFPHCRVDLYNIDGAIYFGEITFYHGGGCNDVKPEEWDYKMGSWIDIHSPKIVKEKK